jgi:hypothetical protein
MPATLDRVEVGIALSPAEADRLKEKIGAFCEGLPILNANTEYKLNDYKDASGTLKPVTFTVLVPNGRNTGVWLKKYGAMP